eukprot:3166402-Pyramimonas_sp.AAC.1
MRRRMRMRRRRVTLEWGRGLRGEGAEEHNEEDEVEEGEEGEEEEERELETDHIIKRVCNNGKRWKQWLEENSSQ